MAYVYINPRKQQLDVALQQRAMALAEIESLTQQIAEKKQIAAQWDAYISALAPLVENDPGEALQTKGLAEICRMALEAYRDWVTAQQVRNYIQQLGIQLQYTNVMAVLHTTLRRVGQAAHHPNGSTVYGMKGLPLTRGMRPI